MAEKSLSSSSGAKADSAGTAYASQHVPDSKERAKVIKRVWKETRPEETNTRNIDYSALSYEIRSKVPQSLETLKAEVAGVLGPVDWGRVVLRISNDVAFSKKDTVGETSFGTRKNVIDLYHARDVLEAKETVVHELVHVYLYRRGISLPEPAEEALCDAVGDYVIRKMRNAPIDNRTVARGILTRVEGTWQEMEFLGFVSERSGRIDERSALKKFYRKLIAVREIDRPEGKLSVQIYDHASLALGKYLVQNSDRNVPELLREICDSGTALKVFSTVIEEIDRLDNSKSTRSKAQEQLDAEMLELRRMLRSMKADAMSLLRTNPA